ncbi:HAMP domain-containing histidine kinase [Nonomuraea gerenzanensis]|uniref:histidine kinase n=1 Tax=Nonomuraea gerenzanensis TaxID=93944 RepID=A0A1M4EK03_9ACTN|nr:HAMP domain-containing sensor histidine kinase [Nonomuraea gerenzanensis]UBU10782.1 HAMP domain-containing histidine kinase [Nonomuraea gerenzanensis]SBO99211.1 two-component system sensor kinase [Nonomuraea gerenzanensis]
MQEAPPPSGPPAWDGPPPPGQPAVTRSTMDRVKELPGKVSIRWRLTLTYGAFVFVAAGVLLLSVYAIVARSIDGTWPPLDSPTLRDQIIWDDARTKAVAAAQQALLSSSLMALVGVGILALIIGYFVADRALKPVAQMTATARKLSESTLAHQRIALEGPHDELKELADTFDAMLARLNVAFDTQRRFVANASHELRTPLTINRTVLEIALSDPVASEDLKALGRTLLEVNARNEKLIEGLLLLARSERELAVRKPLDVMEVAQTAVEQVTPFAEEHGVTVSTELVSAPTIGDPVLLERSVSNLLENAVKYNIPENGKVWIRTGMADGALVVQVANTGQHVPAYEVNSLFEPFRRLHADRVDSAKGSGLGLSIVRAVVQAHGGNVAAVPRDGGGLVVTIRLPMR